MIVIRMQLYCEWDGCESFFPLEGPVDGALYTVADLRAIARKHSWSRTGGKDVCSGCKVKIDRGAKLLLDQYRQQNRKGGAK